jgi:hypothetical protein
MVCLPNSGPRDALNFGHLILPGGRAHAFHALAGFFGDASPSKRIPKSVASSWTF